GLFSEIRKICRVLCLRTRGSAAFTISNNGLEAGIAFRTLDDFFPAALLFIPHICLGFHLAIEVYFNLFRIDSPLWASFTEPDEPPLNGQVVFGTVSTLKLHYVIIR